ncbi:MAG: HD-GYP domain-containing protein [Halanaerobium sp.]
MPEKQKLNNPAAVGLDTAKFLTDNYTDTLIYEKTARFLYQRLDNLIDQLRFYVIDKQKQNFKEEVIYTEIGWRPGYDVIPFYQLPEKITDKREILQFEDNNQHFLLIPLVSGSQLLGLIEMRLQEKLGEQQLAEIEEMALGISLGLSSVIFKLDTIRTKKNTDISIEINSRLQSIDNLNILITTFMELIIENFSFDRVTTFIVNQDQEIIYGEGITENGNKFLPQEFPELPDLSRDFIPLENALGYWFPLKANTAVVGAVLFDNIYTLHPFSEMLLDSLRILCSQFANSINNLRLFSDLQKSAFYDSLTGLHNRAYLDKVLPKYREQKQLPLAVIVGDINGLKITNDVFGHDAGDQILKKIADILSSITAAEDLVIRWGGDEFFLLLPGKDKKAADRICQAVKNACQQVDDLKINLSISLGSAVRKGPEADLETVMQKAEDRMYRHKLLETKEFRQSLLKSLRETLTESCQEPAGHGERMSELAAAVGSKMGLTGVELEELKVLALLHDIGKVAVDNSILNKAEPLTEKEWREVKKHSEAGYRIAKASFELSSIAVPILSHHENWDGSGYPLGKKGTEIPLLARIISVLDAYDVMTHHRPYQEAISHEAAVEELKRGAGKQFDPEIVEIFCSIQFKRKLNNFKNRLIYQE